MEGDDDGEIVIDLSSVQELTYIQISCYDNFTIVGSFQLFIEIINSIEPRNIYPLNTTLVLNPNYIYNNIGFYINYYDSLPIDDPGLELNIINNNKFNSSINNIVLNNGLRDNKRIYYIFNNDIVFNIVNDTEYNPIITFECKNQFISQSFNYFILDEYIDATFVITFDLEFISNYHYTQNGFTIFINSKVFNVYFANVMKDSNYIQRSNMKVNINYPYYHVSFDVLIGNKNNNNNKRILLENKGINEIFKVINTIINDTNNKKLFIVDNFILKSFIYKYNYIKGIVPTSTPDKKKKSKLLVILLPIFAILLLVIIFIVGYVFYHKKSRHINKFDNSYITSIEPTGKKTAKVTPQSDYKPYIQNKVLYEGYLWKEGRKRVTMKFQVLYINILEKICSIIYRTTCF